LPYQKELIIITQNALQGSKPEMREVERRLKKSIIFRSDSQNGDLYAGRSRRNYYFSTKKGAVEDAREKAIAWVNQQSAVICPQKR